MEEIYYKGSIQEGSIEAMRTDRSLVFFVFGEGCWKSMKWESVYLSHKEILPLIKDRSILFKLKSGSVEAGFVAMFCPVQTAPYLAVVKNGSLKTKITSDAEDDTFITSLKSALSVPSPPPPEPASPTTSQTVSALSSLFAERRARLEQRQKETCAQKVAETRRRQENLTPDRKKYVEEQKKRLAEEKAERERILLAVEDDRIERRIREQRKRQARSTSSATPVDLGPDEVETIPFNQVSVGVRLFDGRILKARFFESAVLGVEVRAWVDENRTDGGEAYLFMQPPGRKLTVFDENSSLKELKLSRSVNLVLVHR